MKLVYHPLSCVINKRFNILLNGMTTVWIWDWQSFGLSQPTTPDMFNASITIQVQNSARE